MSNLNLAGISEGSKTSNVSDWSLQKFREVYSHEISKEDIWEYLYGVMHAPDWRQEFQTELRKNLPRVPLVPGGIKSFRSFQRAGRELFDLHVNYEFGPEADLKVILDEGGDYRIRSKMRFLENKRVLEINPTCRIIGIPPTAHTYQISGWSPLEWAVDSLRVKHDKTSGIVSDVNGWRAWKSEPFELVRHLRRLAYVGIRSAEIIAALPHSLPSERF